ncbi:hypothetical protein LZ575_01250 [Antarcticibacterium sp. 1MA-6-2]|uniref:hypothetical protein n=1 Tax=Antarcticibacterium sp. 1MA-6-2 TaxID=2908210 RepID=UPI001F194DF3|nr:hypothetical protein [Antarcticibacterium sp. 1MA-6-2]UJH91442.1 hypothetical protein LZ575_01250 [Antarcticibacterium sp. 1MA-6-2]
MDWSQWQVVYVSVDYNEPENNYKVSKNIRLDSANPMQSFEVMPFSNNSQPFKYTLKFAKAGSSPIDVPLQENTSGLLLIEDPQAIDNPPVEPQPTVTPPVNP